MLLKSKYRVVFLITTLLIILSLSISTINYVVSLNNAQSQLKDQALPLSLDNIYTDIQKSIIQPYLVSSLMANDTFVQDWLVNDEDNSQKIIRYLEAIKNKYDMFNTFLVSDKTKNYYTQNGFTETIDKNKKDNQWYFRFKNIQNKHEINLDFNEHLSNHMIMFINYKIFDHNFHFLGATGVALKISYIDDLLKSFRLKHKFIVTFFDKNGRVVLSERTINKKKTLDDYEKLKEYKELILSKKTNVIEYKKEGNKYILNTKYIPELDLYLTVEANLNDFTEDVENVFYLNLLTSIVITFIISFLIYFIIKNYSKKLEYLSSYDTLTNIPNRRTFEEKFNSHLLLKRRRDSDLGVIFFDVDDFKSINDKLGHQKGDMVLRRIASILKKSVRKTDLIARWGGEEFIVALIDSSLDDTLVVCEKIRSSLEEDLKLKNICNYCITASFGLTMVSQEDTIEKVVQRADEAMYEAKKEGKNRTKILN
ncbi:sensor domain-containing diguanylate cyclase [Halarcobacter anaerophilus]|uniref:diguanylate cyclase n=1 Tax=Halarcobacter anaerophilus TaxID=877500 RepID=A0A4Q0Y3S6_9BACT|nr:sensor domain-containing diguanylate cyclase [Halarcobacter anaerophilus]QDF29583.1 Cache sensor-containing diguanylate cyclase [Halarcobacter anaerophilus]RXJ64817.1 GGDEF domain-containing protein [Halarcobacter anaerophilus]